MPRGVAAVPPPPLDPTSARRERRALVRRREVELRDVGGLAVEMVRRDRFNPELLLARCSDVLGLERRINDLDSYLVTAEGIPRPMQAAALCKCGAPLLRGAHFCSHCGRPTTDAPPVVACGHCGNPLPAEANFCSYCGNAVAAEEPGRPGEQVRDRPDETTVMGRLEDRR